MIPRLQILLSKHMLQETQIQYQKCMKRTGLSVNWVKQLTLDKTPPQIHKTTLFYLLRRSEAPVGLYNL